MNHDTRILGAMFELQATGQPVDRMSLAAACGVRGRALFGALTRLVEDGLVCPLLRVADAAGELFFGEVRLTMEGLAVATACARAQSRGVRRARLARARRLVSARARPRPEILRIEPLRRHAA
jgi:DNA-binding GntR family transcriptional regulator